MRELGEDLSGRRTQAAQAVQVQHEHRRRGYETGPDPLGELAAVAEVVVAQDQDGGAAAAHLDRPGRTGSNVVPDAASGARSDRRVPTHATGRPRRG
jgi:hypothetical protein